MLPTLTAAAQRLLVLARMEARSRNVAEIEPLHLFLTLVKVPDWSAARILRELGIRAEGLRRELEARAAKGTSELPRDVELGAEVRRVLELAADEAADVGERLAGTEHLLAALVRLEGQPWADLVERAGLTLEAVRVLLRKRRPFKKDTVEVHWLPEPAREPARASVSLRDLEAKGFRKTKVLRAGDINQLIFKAVQTELAKQAAPVMGDEASQRLVADVEREFEEQKRKLSEIQRRSDEVESRRAEVEARVEQVDEAHRGLEGKLADVNTQLTKDRQELAVEKARLEFEKARALAAARSLAADLAARLAKPEEPLACPRGHGPMDRVVREGVHLAVCPECLSTFFEPGQLEALMRKLEATGQDLWQFLEPDEPGELG